MLLVDLVRSPRTTKKMLTRSSVVVVFCLASVAESSLPRVGYLVLAHDEATFSLAHDLIRVLYDPENWYLLHVDAKYKSPRRDVVASLEKMGENVDWAQIFDVRWARWSMIEPTLWAFVRLLSKEWDVFANLSGDAWPVLTPLALRRWFASTAPYNIVASGPSCPTGLRPTARSEFGDGWHKKQAYPAAMTRDIEAYFGSQWMVLRRDFVDFVVHELENPESPASSLRDFFVDGWVTVEGVGLVRPHIPDETFFPSLLAYHNFSLPDPVLQLPGGDVITAGHYVRMDEHYPWSSSRQRYVAGTLDKRERPWGPYYLGVYDLLDIKASRAAFVRKTSPEVDPNLYAILPVEDHALIPPITWPSHAALTLAQAHPRIHTVTRGNQTDCVRVAESVHCPPSHRLRPDVRHTHALARSRLLAAHPDLDSSLDLDDLLRSLARLEMQAEVEVRGPADELR